LFAIAAIVVVQHCTQHNQGNNKTDKEDPRATLARMEAEEKTAREKAETLNRPVF
jgi:hypothetical protein